MPPVKVPLETVPVTVGDASSASKTQKRRFLRVLRVPEVGVGIEGRRPELPVPGISGAPCHTNTLAALAARCARSTKPLRGTRTASLEY